MSKSEFGKGLTYNLGLFLAHQDRFFDKRNDKEKDLLYAGVWFNGAGDHMFDLVIPKSFPEKLQKRLKRFQDKVIKFRNSFGEEVTEKDIQWSLNEAKNLLILIDKQFGINAVKGEYE